jgi:hypothetical protein
MGLTQEEQDAALMAQRIALTQAVGECILAWSDAELRMTILFSIATRMAMPMAESILASARAFDARGQMLHRAMHFCLKENSAALSDWNLIYNHIRFLAGKRNEIAHATMMNDAQVGLVLEPYFQIMSEHDRKLGVEYVRAQTREFVALIPCINWIQFQIARPSLPQTASALRAPDRLLQLRIEEQQRREEQRKQRRP